MTDIVRDQVPVQASTNVEEQSSKPTASAEGVQIFRHTRLGDILVFDKGRPGAGYVQFYDPVRNELRKFLRDSARTMCERVTERVICDRAVAAYQHFLSTAEAAPVSVSPSARPVATIDRAARQATAVALRRSPELERVRQHLATSDRSPLLVTGRAGTGKSTLLKELALELKGSCVVLAPTGLAALNVDGQTIHKFFEFPLEPLSPSNVRTGRWPDIAASIETLIIDEVSMARADVLDGIDTALRKRAGGSNLVFGGVRVVMFGDPYQLPPVVSQNDIAAFGRLGYASRNFFDAHVLSHAPLARIELQIVYRQCDPEWRTILDRLRDNSLEASHWSALHSRVQSADSGELDDTMILTARRADAEKTNERRLAALDDEPFTYAADRHGTFATGNQQQFPAPERLVLKRGARVMFVKNDKSSRWVNGTLGNVENLDDHEVSVQLQNGPRVDVERSEWSQIVYELNAHGKIRERVVGSYRQFPLQLAWAVTIHKSQGLTFDRVHVHLGDGAFAAGQTYVALSRCRTIEGMTLERPLHRRDVSCDPRIEQFMDRVTPRLPSQGGVASPNE